MARCFLCGAETKSPVGEATVREGWVFTEFRGKFANKYGVFCPEHELEEMREACGLMLERAAVPDGKRSTEAEAVRSVPASKDGTIGLVRPS